MLASHMSFLPGKKCSYSFKRAYESNSLSTLTQKKRLLVAYCECQGKASDTLEDIWERKKITRLLMALLNG